MLWGEVCGAGSEAVLCGGVDSEGGSDVLMDDSGVDPTDRLCGGDHLGGIQSGGDHYTGCRGL